VLDAEPDMEVVGTAADGAELLHLARSARPTVAVLGVDANAGSTGRIVAGLRAAGTTRVVGLFGHLTRAQARELHAAGATALVDRHRGVETVFSAIRSESPLRLDITALERSAPVPNRILTAREIEVLGFVGKGITSREISDQLGISRKTVENYKQRSFQKLGVQNQAHAVSVAMRRGLLAPIASAGR
ncbi:MAG: LuxR C-terminal-related transcriptional regulator, partial [Nocardioidaceae bacterium]